MQIYKKGDIMDIWGVGTVQKGMPMNAATANLEELTVFPSMLSASLQTRARFLPRELICKCVSTSLHEMHEGK